MGHTLNSPEIKRRGGSRPGAGRKPAELTLRFREYFGGSLDELLRALAELAMGHHREDSRGRVYRVAPDRTAIIYVLDRMLGRPREEGETSADLAALLAELRRDGQRTNA
ncbi:MAG: hypothetical protein GTN93_34550 [Anaerolineae bacterium]|nr:hypothetical protein [Anaerolineae bacterium]